MDIQGSDSRVSELTLGLLPEPRNRVQKFVVSYGVQSLILAFFVIVGVMNPDILVPRDRDYHFVSLVSTPPPVPSAPAPVRNFRAPTPPPTPEITPVVEPRPEALRVPAEVVQKKPVVPEEKAPAVTLAAKKELLPDAKPIIPRPPVKTNVFSTGSSATPTMAAAPSKVQTGGFGDPNGVPAQDTHGHPVTIAQSGSFDMPNGPGSGNGTGGSHGARGVVASSGFGSGVATGSSTGISASRGEVRQGGFGDADVVAASQPKTKVADPVAKTMPVEITFKPHPVYTDEGRQLKIEGEVLVQVVFSATGQIRIVKVVRGLGHGLDESAIRAAEKIQFKPALKNGLPADSEAVLHIEFQLAS
jgi:TonB family protein